MKAPRMFLVLACLLKTSVASKEFHLIISPKERDYDRAVVVARVPEEFPKVGLLKSETREGPDLPFQSDEEGGVVFVLPANKCSFLTSNGETHRMKGNETEGKWCHMGGIVDGAHTGIERHRKQRGIGQALGGLRESTRG